MKKLILIVIAAVYPCIGISIDNPNRQSSVYEQIKHLLKIPYRVDGARLKTGPYTKIADRTIRFSTPGFNCSGFLIEFTRNVLQNSVSIDQAIVDRKNDSGKDSPKGHDWDFGLDLIQNLSEGLNQNVLRPSKMAAQSLEYDSERGFNIHEESSWNYLLNRFQENKLYFFTINKPLFKKGYKILHYHVGVIVKEPLKFHRKKPVQSSVSLYHTTRLASTHRIELSHPKGLEWFHRQFKKSAYSDKYIYLLEVDLPKLHASKF